MKSIRARLVAALVTLLLCTMVLGGTSLYSQRQQSAIADEIATDIVEHLALLKVISDRYAVDVVDAAHKARNGNFTFEQSRKAMLAALADVDKNWKVIHEASHATEAAKTLGDVDKKLKVAREATTTMVAMLERNDKAGLEKFIVEKMYAAIDPGTEALGGFIDGELVGARELMARMNASSTANFRITVLVGTAALAICLMAIAFVIFLVARPLDASIATMNALARHTVGSAESGEARLVHLEQIQVFGTERRDEIGQMARSLAAFREAGIERQRLRIDMEARQASQIERAERLDRAVGEFERGSAAIIATVAASASQLEASARAMLEQANTTIEMSNRVTADTSKSSESLNSLTEIGGQLAASIGEIGRQAKESSTFAAAASSRARETDETVRKLTEAGDAIVEVVGLIRTIAAQTNLLALNATIEAARAGEAGRGFAVVASEVKELASQTTRATEIIAEHVQSIQAASQNSIAAMSEIGRMIEDINQAASLIASAVEEQGFAANDIQRDVVSVSKGTERALSSISAVAEGASSTGSAASQVLSASEDLAAQSIAMRSRIDEFLLSVRAA